MKNLYPDGRMESDILHVPAGGMRMPRSLSKQRLFMFE